jgi:hypothetical protein
MKRTWTKETAKAWIMAVNSGKEKMGLKFCSACDFLGLTVEQSKVR